MNARGLTPKRAARYLGISTDLLNKWRSDNKEPRVPQPVDCRGTKLFAREELDAFFDELKSLRGSPAK